MTCLIFKQTNFMEMRNTSLAAIILVGGMMLLLTSFVHFLLGYPNVIQTLREEASSQEVSHLLKIIWIFSSIAMALCGIWAMFIGISIRKNLRYTKKQALILGSGITFFGIYGFMSPFPNFQLGSFLVIGLIILLPAFFLSKEQGPYH